MITPTQKQLIEQKAEGLFPSSPSSIIGIHPRKAFRDGATYFAENLAMRWVKRIDEGLPKEYNLNLIWKLSDNSYVGKGYSEKGFHYEYQNHTFYLDTLEKTVAVEYLYEPNQNTQP